RVPVAYEGRGFLQPALAVNGPQGWPDGSDQSQLARSFGSNVQRFGRAMSLALTLSMARYRTLRALPLRLGRSFCGLQRATPGDEYSGRAARAAAVKKQLAVTNIDNSAWGEIGLRRHTVRCRAGEQHTNLHEMHIR